MGWITSLFSGGMVQSIENIASEWITTDMESAEAKVLMVKTLDPNGLMRRRLSERVTDLYTLYILITLMLLIFEIFCVCKNCIALIWSANKLIFSGYFNLNIL